MRNLEGRVIAALARRSETLAAMAQGVALHAGETERAVDEARVAAAAAAEAHHKAASAMQRAVGLLHEAHGQYTKAGGAWLSPAAAARALADKAYSNTVPVLEELTGLLINAKHEQSLRFSEDDSSEIRERKTKRSVGISIASINSALVIEAAAEALGVVQSDSGLQTEFMGSSLSVLSLMLAGIMEDPSVLHWWTKSESFAALLGRETYPDATGAQVPKIRAMVQAAAERNSAPKALRSGVVVVAQAWFKLCCGVETEQLPDWVDMKGGLAAVAANALWKVALATVAASVVMAEAEAEAEAEATEAEAEADYQFAKEDVESLERLINIEEQDEGGVTVVTWTFSPAEGEGSITDNVASVARYGVVDGEQVLHLMQVVTKNSESTRDFIKELLEQDSQHYAGKGEGRVRLTPDLF